MFSFVSATVLDLSQPHSLRFWLKNNLHWYLSRQISIHWIIIRGCDTGTLYANQNQPTMPSWRLPCYWYGIICHRSSLIKKSFHFKRDFDSMLLQLTGTLNTQFKYREGSWHSLLKHLKCWRKRCAKLDSLLLNIQDATVCSLEQMNFKV